MTSHTKTTSDSDQRCRNFTEFSDDTPCGCGSGKPYGKCCQTKKRIRYGINSQGDIVRQIPMSQDSVESLKELRESYMRLYGRGPRDEDSVFGFATSHADSLSDDTRRLLRAGLPIEKVYAYHMSEGLLPTEQGLDLMPTKDLAEYEGYVREFESMAEEFESAEQNSNGITSVQRPIFITYGNELLDGVGQEISRDLRMILNDFLARFGEEGTFLNFEIRQPLDYALFSVYKTRNILESVDQLAEEDLPESIYALSRSLFENYLYLKAITKSPEFFGRKILPKADQVNFRFVTKDNGEINYYYVENRHTGERHNIEVKVKELPRISDIKEDQIIYQLFFATASQYVHVDVLSAREYFHDSDPFEEFNPACVARIFSLALAGMVLETLSEIPGVDRQLTADYRYFLRTLFERLTTPFTILDSDPVYRNDAYRAFLDRITIWGNT